MIAFNTTKLRGEMLARPLFFCMKSSFLLLIYAAFLIGLGTNVFAQGDVGLYSGTFDLPHNTHKEIAEHVASKFNLKKLFILVNPVADHKTGVSPLRNREVLVDKLFENTVHSSIEVQNVFLKRAFFEDDVSGALRSLESQYKGKKIYQIMGMDSFERYLEVENPYRPENFNLVVFSRFTRSKRKRRKRDAIFKDFQDKHPEVTVHLISISSDQQKRSSQRIKRQLSKILKDTSPEVLAEYISNQCKQGFEKGN